jgi:hypothetical protein
MTDPTDDDTPILPRNAVRAIRVTTAGTVLTIVETILTVADRDSLRRRIVMHDPASHHVDALINIAAVSGLLAGVVATVLWIRFIRAIRRGENWTQVATWALLLAAVLLPVIALTDVALVLDAVLAGLWGTLTIAVIVLLTVRVVARWT